MKLNLPYAPGYSFWSPRVLSQTEIETIEHGGKEYSRKTSVLEIAARHKKIVRVEVTVKENQDPQYRYWAETVNGDTFLPSLVNPYEGFASEQQALDFARHWRATQQTEYFGAPLELPDDTQDYA